MAHTSITSNVRLFDFLTYDNLPKHLATAVSLKNESEVVSSMNHIMSKEVLPLESFESYNASDQNQNSSSKSTAFLLSSSPLVISIIIPLSGEMGNQLSSVARGIAIQHWARDVYGMTTELLLLDTGKTRGQGTRDWQQCFPSLRSLHLHGNTMKEYEERLVQQQEWLGKDLQEQLHVRNSRVDDIEQSLTVLNNILQWTNRTEISSKYHANNNISLPFLTVEGDFVLVDALADKYYHVFRNFFLFDYSNCCRLQPDPDESVLVRTYGVDFLMQKDMSNDMMHESILCDSITMICFSHHITLAVCNVVIALS
jgi:hypothetical protein